MKSIEKLKQKNQQRSAQNQLDLCPWETGQKYIDSKDDKTALNQTNALTHLLQKSYQEYEQNERNIQNEINTKNQSSTTRTSLYQMKSVPMLKYQKYINQSKHQRNSNTVEGNQFNQKGQNTESKYKIYLKNYQKLDKPSSCHSNEFNKYQKVMKYADKVKKFKKNITRQQFKSSSITCLFSRDSKAQTHLNSQGEKENQLLFQKKCKKIYEKLGFLQKTTYNYPIYQKKQNNKSVQKTISNSKRLYKSQEQTMNVSPSKNQNEGKVLTLRTNETSYGKISFHQNSFLKPRKQIKSKKDLTQNPTYLQSQSKMYLIKKNNQNYENLNAQKINKLLRPLRKVTLISKQKNQKYTSPYNHLEQEQNYNIKSKNNAHKLLLAEYLKIKNKKELSSDNGRYINKQNLIQNTLNKQNLIKNDFLKTLIQNKENELCKQISISIFQHRISPTQILKSKFIQKQCQNFQLYENSQMLINKVQNIDMLKESPFYLRQPSVSSKIQSSSKNKIFSNKDTQNHQKITLRKLKGTKSQLPKIQLFYQNQSQTKVKRTFQSSKLLFYSKKQCAL